MNDFTSKNPKKLRVDPEKKLIFIPGRDEPEELIAPIVQRTDADGTPYQHVVTATEMIEAEEQHKRAMQFVRDAMKHTWKCVQCGTQRPGTELRPSGQLLELLREMMQPGGHRIDWESITRHLHEHLLCPEEISQINGKKSPCLGACMPLPRKAAP